MANDFRRKYYNLQVFIRLSSLTNNVQNRKFHKINYIVSFTVSEWSVSS